MGECHAGHLNAATISATCELVIDVIDGEIGRKFSDEIGLNLYEFSERTAPVCAGAVL